jgi:hypothetical protein
MFFGDGEEFLRRPKENLGNPQDSSCGLSNRK